MTGHWSTLPELAELVHDEPFWPYPIDHAGGEDAARLRVWSTPPGVLAVVTELGLGSPFHSITNCAERIWSKLAREYPNGLVVLEHYPAGESGPEHFDQMRLPANRAPEWRRIWPTTTVNPRHAEFTRWMSMHGPTLLGRHAEPDQNRR